MLITDFYAAYESVDCEQQKCLIHLIRDMNDDLKKNPWDDEFKLLIGEFGQLLRTIVTTIDEYGLKRRHLKKHIKDVERFYRMMAQTSYRSDVAQRYSERLTKGRGKLFTFLMHDGVPWNNNNAEHAIKHFAYYRREIDGVCFEDGLADYLVLLSLRLSCKYKGMSFLRFLLSQEQDIDKFSRSPRRKMPTVGLQQMPDSAKSYRRDRKIKGETQHQE